MTKQTTADKLIAALTDLGFREMPDRSQHYRVFRGRHESKLVMIGKCGACRRGESVSRSMSSDHTKHILLMHWEDMQKVKGLPHD